MHEDYNNEASDGSDGEGEDEKGSSSSASGKGGKKKTPAWRYFILTHFNFEV